MWSGLDASLAQTVCVQQNVKQPPDVAKIRAKHIDPITAGAVTNIFLHERLARSLVCGVFLDAAKLPAGKDLSVMVLAQASHAEELSTSETFGLPAAFEAHQRFAALAGAWLAK